MLDNLSDTDVKNLNLALDAALKAYDLGNYPVGAVLTIDNVVVGSGENKINEGKSYFNHAEISLIATHSSKLYDAYSSGKQIVLYSTLEPCIQCLGAAVTNHINKIIYITKDPNGGACDIKHDNIGDWYKHTWPEIVYAPISENPLELMVRFFKNEIVKGNTKWPEKMLRLYNAF